MTNNSAGYYGNDQASFPVQIVKIIDQMDPNEIGKAYPGKSAAEIFTKYVNLSNGTEALGPIEKAQIDYYPTDGSRF